MPKKPSIDETADRPIDLEEIIQGLIRTAHDDEDRKLTVAEVLDTVGERSFGPLLLIPGLIGVSPIGAIPGVPLTTSIIEFFIASQIILGLDHIWLPGFLTRRWMSADRMENLLKKVMPIARRVDHFLMPRMTFLTRGAFFYVIAGFCLIISMMTPFIEPIPLAGIVPNAALVAFGLAVIAQDGLWALIAMMFTGGSFYLIYSFIFG